MASLSNRCIVLNNQHLGRLQEFADRVKRRPSSRVLFQPYTTNHQRKVYEAWRQTPGLPVFFIVGNYGETVTYSGRLECMEYGEDVEPKRKAELSAIKSKYDRTVYATNLLTVSHFKAMKNPRPVGGFIKAKGGALLRGNWPAVVCRLPKVRLVK
jgi:hypothetical protein